MNRIIKINRYSRKYYTAIFDKCAVYGGPRGISYRYGFRNIIDEEGNKIAEYIYFNNLESLKNLHLEYGDIIRFKARPVDASLSNASTRYYTGQDMFQRLMNPTQIIKLSRPVKRIEENNSFNIHIKTI